MTFRGPELDHRSVFCVFSRRVQYLAYLRYCSPPETARVFLGAFKPYNTYIRLCCCTTTVSRVEVYLGVIRGVLSSVVYGIFVIHKMVYRARTIISTYLPLCSVFVLYL